MLSFIHRLASPKHFYSFAKQLQPWLFYISITLFLLGLVCGLWLAPVDYQQGDAYRIMFLHVPAAVMSLAIYMLMAVAVVVFLVWKIKLADMLAKISAPLGAAFTMITLVTGSLWGKPTWGTCWIWDARLTSELFLLFSYLGLIALRSAIPDERLSDKAVGFLTLVGVVNIPIVHYSVVWWHTLHPGASLLKFAKPSIAPVMLLPLLVMFTAYVTFYFYLLLLQMRSEILIKQRSAKWVQQLH